LLSDIRAIDFTALRDAAQIRGVVFDKDNCLTLPYDVQLHPPLQEAWAACRAVFGNNCVVFSNHAGSPDDKDGAAASRIEHALGVCRGVVLLVMAGLNWHPFLKQTKM
jgi:phosphatidylglycerophosphatase GEP4